MKNLDLFDALDSSLPAQVTPQETELPPVPPESSPGGSDNDDGSIDLAEYTHQVYLRYAISVDKGRALPSVSDGAKPVQRRILYATHRLIDLYLGPLKDPGRIMVELRRMADRFPETIDGQGALAELKRRREEGQE